LPTPRGLSQAPTSFIGSWCQDIHRLPLVACHTTKNYKDARVHYAVLKIRAGTPTRPTTTLEKHPTQGKKHTPSGHPHQEFGEGWPQPHHHTNHHPQGLQSVRQVTQKNQNNPQQRAGPIPQDPTARLDPSPRLTHVPHSHPSNRQSVSSTSSINRDPNLMVNVPQSEAPPP
jgi:hypothetical protein